VTLKVIHRYDLVRGATGSDRGGGSQSVGIDVDERPDDPPLGGLRLSG